MTPSFPSPAPSIPSISPGLPRRVQGRTGGSWLVLGLSLALNFRASLAASAAPGETAAIPPVSKPAAITVSRAAVQQAIDRGVTWLLSNQNSNGWWSTAEQPAVTALALTALNREPSRRFTRQRPSELSRAYEFILGSVKPDGSIHRGALANYNTSLSLVALSTAEDPNFLPVIRQARAYLAGTQIDFEEKGKLDSPFDGGVGYGSKYQHSDLNNTLAAIEAMRASEAALPKDAPAGTPPAADLNWAAVASFIQNCQNLSSHNSADWVSTDPKDRGGFVYYPGQSMAGGVTNATTGRVALRSYGSISYGGLLSYAYAKVDRRDPRVVAVLEWLQSNYTLEENPGMGPQGYFYYLHLMTKALTATKIDTLKLADGREVRWREEVARRLVELQQPNGSWINENKRWWETDPNLVSSYVLLSLELLLPSLGKS